MSRILATAATEFRIALRNRWVAIAIAMMAVFSLALAAAGSAPTGALGVDRLSVTVASLTSLAVYLVPLVALLMSFDAISGEIERGTLPLLLTYPASRAQIVLGKFLAHMAVLALATGTAVAQTGLIGFVGLVAPHLVRGLARSTHGPLLLLSALAGGLLLMAASEFAGGIGSLREGVLWGLAGFATRSLPIASLDAGMYFDRDTSFGGTQPLKWRLRIS